MVTVPINFTGGDYQHRSRPLSKQWTRNFWPQVMPNQKARSNYTLQSFYGLKTWEETVVGNNRGMIVSQGTLYRVAGTTLYSVDIDGNHTSLGFIAGSNRCILKDMESKIIITNGSGAVYVYDSSAGTVTQVTDPNLGSPNGVAVLNNQAIYDNGSGQIFDVSDVGDPATINGLNNAKAESSPDDLLLPYVYGETLYLLGTKTTEIWWNSGQGNPPFDRVQGASLLIGLGAKYSLAETPDFLFFFGSDKQFHTLTGGTTSVDTIISTPAMAEEFQDYAVTDDVIGWTMQLEGQWFYVATFPNQNVTWVYPVGGEWFQWGTGLTGRIRADSYVYAYGTHLVAAYNDGNLYELDNKTYTDVGDTIVRTRDTAPLHGGLFQADGKYFELNELTFFLETGQGLLTGQGSDPSMAISFSKDGGKTFGTERFIKVGKSGENRKRVSLKNCGRFMSCVIRIRVSDPIYWSIFNGVAEVEPCI